jgi:hypothetical protein
MIETQLFALVKRQEDPFQEKLVLFFQGKGKAVDDAMERKEAG